MVTNNTCDEPTAATGKILQAQGIGSASNFSTATYPATATGTGKILRADGTNWVATTATYPNTAGTSGNVLTSDGTNWSSSTPASGVYTNGFITSLEFDPADSTTYYFLIRFEQNTVSSTTNIRYYLTNTVTINRVYGAFGVSGTLGSAQNCTFFIRKNDTTNTNVTTSLQLTATSNSFNATGLGISLVAGDFITFGFTGPAWTTNPLGVSLALGFSP